MLDPSNTSITMRENRTTPKEKSLMVSIAKPMKLQKSTKKKETSALHMSI